MNDADNMVARVAEAIKQSIIENWSLNPEHKEFEQHACAAMEAMRDPTTEMIAGSAAYPATDEEVVACWQYMIDEALSTKEAPGE